MTMRMRLMVVLCAVALMGGVCFGQNNGESANAQTAQTAPGDGQHYKVVFVVEEVEGGRVINARRYVSDMALRGQGSGVGSIRTGSKIPITTGATQFTFVDVGFDVDFNQARLEGDRVFLSITANLSSADTPPSDSPLHQPTIKQNRWSSGVTVPLGKPTIIFSSDDMSSKRTIQIELTVTPVR